MIVHRPLGLLALTLLSGCAWRVAIDANVPNATLTRGDEVVMLPAELVFEGVGRARHDVRVTAPGYRPLTVHLSKDELHPLRVAPQWVLRGRRTPQGRITFLLVPEHGPATSQPPP